MNRRSFFISFIFSFSFIYFFLALATLIIGTYTDLKERIISNKLTYSMIAVGVILHLIEAAYFSNYFLFFVSVVVVVLTFFFSYLLWKLGVWAGGDVKLFTAIAALNPFNPLFFTGFLGLNIGLFQATSLPIFPLTLFIFSIICMIPYGAFLTLNGVRKRKDLQRKLKEEFKKKFFQALQLSAALIGLNYFVSLFMPDFLIQYILIIVTLIALRFINRKVRLIVIALVFFFALGSKLLIAVNEFVSLFLVLFVIYSFFRLFFLSREEILKKEIRVDELEEGMIPAQSIYLVEGKIVKSEPLKIATIIKYLTSNNLNQLMDYLKPKGKTVVSSMRAAGFTVEEIKELKELVRERKIEEKIKVKLTAPMIPAVLMAFVLLNVIGDILWNMIL
ncbi:prepilin peptidase [Candidatus Micrarchaeota archaeon]|nr:prepilin peptidase [Candidatus Micrarchaeota archaeon]